jgi:small subunit ribosomal protein S1
LAGRADKFAKKQEELKGKFIVPEIEGFDMDKFDLEDVEGYESFTQMLSGGGYNPQALERGVTVTGTISSIEVNNSACVDIGTKAEATITFEEATLLGNTETRLSEVLNVGDQYEFKVLGGKTGMYDTVNTMLTRKPILIQEAWEKVEEFAKDGPTFMAKVVKANMGGVLVSHPGLGGLTGFVPGSMIVQRPVTNESLIGEELEVKFLQADKADQRIILSNRAAVQDKAMKQIKENDLVEGTVAGIMNFGVFVDVLGVRGMIHVSQVSGLFVDPVAMEKIFPIGSKLKAVATKTDFAKGKLALSTRILETVAGEMRTDPQKVYEGAEERHKTLQEQWKLEQEARERERRELESQIMDLTLSVFDGEEASKAAAGGDAPAEA